MGAEFTALMSDGSFYTFEHDVTRLAVGDIESVRARLADALEERGYRVLNDNPLQAKRSARGGAATGCTNDILDFSTSVSIGLKAAGPNTTRVVFSYVVKQVYTGYLSRGDRNTLTREAEAIIALTNARALPAACSVCGAEVVGSSRFCRQCGAPKSLASPAELEVLRLTAGANASYKSIAAGTFFIIAGLLLPLVLFFIDQDPVKFAKTVKFISILASSAGLSGLIMLLFGARRLRKLLLPSLERDAVALPSRSNPGAPDTNSLPPSSLQSPVTEATTDLLPHEAERLR